MNVPMIRLSAIVLTATFAASAHAGYRCDSPSTNNDRQACTAAAQGPEALRRYISSWPSQMCLIRFCSVTPWLPVSASAHQRGLGWVRTKRTVSSSSATASLRKLSSAT